MVAVNKKAVAVVHGRNKDAADAIFNFLGALNLEAKEWEHIAKTLGGSPYNFEVVEKLFSTTQAAVVILTPDDDASLREFLHNRDEPLYEREPTGQARQNVLIEAGMAIMGGRERTIIVEFGSTRPISDFAGLNDIRIQDAPTQLGVEPLNKLANRLEAAGCDVNRGGRYLDLDPFKRVLDELSKESSKSRNLRNTLHNVMTNIGLVHVEDREDDKNVIPPAAFYGRANREVAISGTSCHSTFTRHIQLIKDLLNDGKQMYILLLSPDSVDLPRVIDREKHSVDRDIGTVIDVIKLHRLYENRAFHVRFSQNLPPFTAVMIDGDLSPTGNQPSDQYGVIRVQPGGFYGSQHEGVVLQLEKIEKGVFDFFAKDFRAQWYAADSRPDLFVDV